MSKKRKKYQEQSNSFSITGIKTRGQNQFDYAEAMETHDVVFGVGPAGVGKTMLATVYGLSLLQAGAVEKVIITRPVRETGEKLGYLPGNINEKMDPYIKPVMDFMLKFMTFATVERMFKSGVIEIAPLAYMRGRTFENAFMLLDEAQNTTPEQMKMFLTRMGNNSKMVITGDINQSDLKGHNGLQDAIDKLDNIPEIKIIHFNSTDVVRHPVVARIVQAYEEPNGNGTP